MLRAKLITFLLGTAVVLSGCAASGSSSVNPSASSPLATVAVGQCTEALPTQSDPNLSVVECNQQHYWEVSAVVEAAGDAYPGADALRQIAETNCAQAFSDYVGVDPASSAFQVTYLAPSLNHWSDPGNRKVACLVGSPGGDLTGSLAGTALSFPTKGQCTGKPVAGSFAIELISCAEPHSYEVYATKKWTGKAAPTTAEFNKLYTSVCVNGFKSFVGISAGKSKYEILYSMVSQPMWKTVKDHRLVCSAGSPKDTITGTLKGVKK